MQTNTAGANSPYDSSIADTIDTFVETVTEALESVGADSDTIDAVEEQGDQVAEAADDEIEELRDQIGCNKDELKEAKEHSGRERAQLSRRVNEVEETIEDVGLDDATPTPNGGETPIQQSDLTPIEQLSRADDVSDVTDSPTVERAVSLFKNLPQWGSKTPKGIVLKPADNPLSLLEADREENLAWKQYYRAAEALEQLSEGSVTFFDSDRHGKMLVLHEQSEAYERAINGTLSPSSVEAST